MSIELTKVAAEHIKNHVFNHEKEVNYLRFGVKVSGCTGFRYVIEIADAKETDDEVYLCHEVPVIVNKHDLKYVKNTKIDYVKHDFSEMFTFYNPNVASECGCGESFSTSMDGGRDG